MRKGNQTGNALAVVLLLLPITVIFSLSMLDGVKHQTKMAGNIQTKTISAIAAESAVSWKWNLEGLFGKRNEKVQEIRTTDLDEDFKIAGQNMKAKVTVCYHGEIPMALNIELNADESNNAYRLAKQVFIVTGEATEAVTNAHSRILQGGYVVRPASGIRGNDCS